MTTERAVGQDALDILDVIDGIVDDTHPEGDGCPLCTALEDLREVLAALLAAPVAVDMLSCLLDCDCHSDPELDHESCDNCTGMSEQERAARLHERETTPREGVPEGEREGEETP